MADNVGDVKRLGNHQRTAGEIAAGITDRAAFLNAAGVATDPTTVTLRVRCSGQPGWTEYTWPTQAAGQLPLVKEAAGRFYADHLITAAPRLYYELRGTGTVTEAEDGELVVQYPRIA